MNLEKYLSVTPEIQAALAEGKPVVALESTILSHGMPYPQNLDFGRKVEQIIRDEGCVPATIAILDGKMKVGLNEEELERMVPRRRRRQGEPPRPRDLSGPPVCQVQPPSPRR